MQLATRKPRKPVTGRPSLRCVPLETADRFEVPRPKEARSCSNYVYCTCDKPYAQAAVVNHDPVTDELSGECTVVRQVFCDSCRHIITWCELATAKGTPLGTVVSGPGYVKSCKAIERFLRKHPQATGITQV